VVLVGFSGSPALPKGGKPLDATALAWYSPDGTTWADATLDGAEGAVSRAATGGPAGYVAVGVGQGGGRIWQSPTGEAWTDVTGESAPKGNIYDVASGPAGYVAVGLTTTGKGKKLKTVPTAWTSADGLTWTSAPIADLDGIGLNVAASPDGGLLAAVYRPQRKGPEKNGTFQMLPPALAFFASTDGVTWTAIRGWAVSVHRRACAEGHRWPERPLRVTRRRDLDARAAARGPHRGHRRAGRRRHRVG
jgi:hypothetical protein